MKKFTLGLFCLFVFTVEAKTESRNPFQNFSNHTLKNGMKVIFAPNPNSKNIKLKLEVQSGSWSEDKKSLHANHVLEHMLFKDGSIEGDKSYLEVIKEEGGDVNAYVTNNHTAYHTNIPAEKGEWLIGIFKKMIFQRNLEEHELKLSQGSVELEIGKPIFFNKWIGFNPVGDFFSSYFPKKNFSEKEFGVTPYPFSREDERLAVRKLELDTVKNIYNDFYYPSNMILMISGNFKPSSMLKLLENTFSDIIDKDGKKLSPHLATTRGEAYHETQPSFDGDQARLSYGIKLFDKKIEDILVADSYMNYVAHRLMIEFRNKKGETYTAHSYSWYENKHGLNLVTFNTPIDKYETNKSYLISLVNRETIDGQLSSDSYKEAVDLYLKEKFESMDIDAEGLMNLAEYTKQLLADFGETRDPYTILKNLSEEDYKRILTSNFSGERPYLAETLPPLLFKYDFIALMFLSILGAVVFFKHALQNHNEIRNTVWVSKTITSPGKVLEVLTLLVSSFLLAYLIQRPIEALYENTHLYRSTMFLSTYLNIVVSFFVWTGLFMWQLSRLPTAVIYTGDKLLIKSLVLKEEMISLDNVLEVKTVGPFKKNGPKHLVMSKFSVMSVVFNWVFWKPSLEIKTKNGASYLVNVSHPKELADKINGILEQHEEPSEPITIMEQVA